MTTRIVIFTSVLTLGCHQGGPSSKQEAAPSPSTTPRGAAPGKGGTADSPAPTSPLRPLPTIQVQPGDLTTSVGASPLVVGIDNLGDPVGPALLNALAAQVHLVDTDSDKEVPVTVSVKDVTNDKYGPDGYRTSEQAQIVLRPSAPLGNGWYRMSVKSTPAGYAWPKFGGYHALPDGSRGARFSPGSRPRPTAVRVCDKGNGVSMVIVDWSERVLLPTVIPASTMATVKETSRGGDCPIELGAGSGASVGSYRFVCRDLPSNKGRLAFSLDRLITSPSGGRLDVAADAFTGKHTTSVDMDGLQETGDDGCRVGRPW